MKLNSKHWLVLSMVCMGVLSAMGCGGSEDVGLWGDWSGVVEATGEVGPQERVSFNMPVRMFVRDAFTPCEPDDPPPFTVSNICPVGGGTFTVARGATSWAGSVTCTPISAWGCDDVTFIIESFAVAVDGDSMTATSTGVAIGCGTNRPVTMNYKTRRAPIAGGPTTQPTATRY